MTYLIAVGHNVAVEDMLPFDPQPETPGMIPTRRTNALSGKVIDEGLYVPYTWPLFDLDEDYRAILAQCGLLTATTALVSIYAQDENYDWVARNGMAIKPEIGTDGRRDFFLQNFTIRVIDLRAQD